MFEEDGVAGDEVAHFYKGAHDVDAGAGGDVGAENAREHGDAFFGEDVREVAATAVSVVLGRACEWGDVCVLGDDRFG